MPNFLEKKIVLKFFLTFFFDADADADAIADAEENKKIFFLKTKI